MAGMLTVVNPRRRRRRARRRGHAKARSHRRRRRHTFAFANPRRRRRGHRRAHNRRRSHRRRHSNPSFRMGGIVSTLTKGATIGVGAVATNVATNAVNRLLGANALTGPGKIGLKIGVGVFLLPMALRFIPGGRKFAGWVAAGAGVAVFLDIYEQYIKAALPSYLQDYSYGSLNDYQTGQLSDWMPQAGLQGAGDGVYDSGTYN